VRDVIKLKAQQARETMRSSMDLPDDPSIDPAIWLALIAMFTELIRLLRDCNRSPEQAVRDMRRPRLVGTVALHRAVRKAVRLHKIPDLAGHFETAVKLVGLKTSAEEVKAMYREVSGG
jgi:hypothetical protein